MTSNAPIQQSHTGSSGEKISRFERSFRFVRESYRNFHPVIRFLIIPSVLSIVILIPKILALNDVWTRVVIAVSIVFIFFQNVILYLEQGDINGATIWRITSTAAYTSIAKAYSEQVDELSKTIANQPDERRQIRTARHYMRLDYTIEQINEALFETVKTFVAQRTKTKDVHVCLAMIRCRDDGFGELFGPPQVVRGGGSLKQRVGKLQLSPPPETLSPPRPKTFASVLWNAESSCIRSVSDVRLAESLGDFRYLDDDEKRFLKSLVCYRIDDLAGERLFMWCVDADVTGAFPDSMPYGKAANPANMSELSALESVFSAFARLVLSEVCVSTIIASTEKVIAHVDTENIRLQTSLGAAEQNAKALLHDNEVLRSQLTKPRTQIRKEG